MGLDSDPFLKPIGRANSIRGQPWGVSEYGWKSDWDNRWALIRSHSWNQSGEPTVLRDSPSLQGNRYGPSSSPSNFRMLLTDCFFRCEMRLTGCNVTCLRWPPKVAICAKAFWPPKSPETTTNPKFSRKSGVAPKSPRNSHWIHTKRHTKPHWIPLNSPEFSWNFPNFPEFAQIPPNPWNFRKIRGGEEFTQSATQKI